MTSNAAVAARPKWEVADVIRRHREAFLSRHGGWLSGVQKRALRDLAACRTAALGGHATFCLDCGHEQISYNSCRNRHCPKCQALTRGRWLEQEAANLLPVEYFHAVFTLPAEVADLALANAALLYDLLFRTAAATLAAVAANPKRLGAVVGALLVLHTWGQNLHHHPHVHAVVSGGGLSCDARGRIDDAPRWLGCRPGFFLPVRVLSQVFRGRYLEQLRQAFDEGKLVFPERMKALGDAPAFAAWLATLYAREWVVYAKRPFGGPEQVLKYLARYTHRVAISNSRLLDLNEEGVTFAYKDYSDDHRQKTMTLSGVEFLRRFVQHVLPRGFVKVRHYGLLANREREDRLALCRRLLVVEAVRPELADAEAAEAEVVPAAPCCPHCGSPRLVRRVLPREDAAWPDTS
jgi:hypothetical protein